MKISYNWLKQYLNLKHSPAETAALLTQGGLEVEGIEEWESLKGGLRGVVTGHVVECVKHPNADRLHVCQVNTGDATNRQIVCGAPNVAAGQKVVVALPGAVLFPTDGESFEIKKSKIRGEASEGMICAEDEIGLGKSHAGIIILPEDTIPGRPASEVFGVETDFVLEIGLTPNRSDAASHIGVARDLKAIFSITEPQELIIPDVSSFKEGDKESPVKVKVHDNDACKRYSGLYIKDITVKPSPEWLQNRLKAIGMRPINNVVDITNYVMMECGQPMHAFDAEQIRGNEINVRIADSGAVFKTLDETERRLNGTELMICDAQEGMCIAGVFGGVNSGVTEKTTSIFLESAYFNPVSVRKTARLHGLHTDSSFRFERGTDPEKTIYALKRAALLMQELAGAVVGSAIVDIYPEKIQPYKMELAYSYVDDLTGTVIDKEKIKTILKALDIAVTSENNNGLELMVPVFKTDVTRPADVVEEIIRIYGYNAVPLPEKISMSMPAFEKKNLSDFTEAVSDYLVSRGFREILNNSLTSEKYLAWNEGNTEAVKLLNPLSSDLNIMRASMLFTGLETVAYNINRRQEQLLLFECGRVYSKTEKGYKEQNRLGIWLAGNRLGENWQKHNREHDIFFLKGEVASLFRHLGLNQRKLHVQELKNNIYDIAFNYLVNGKELATVGKVSRQVLKSTEVDSAVFYADINMDQLMKLITVNDFDAKEPSKFPEVRRDLSMVLDKKISYADVENAAYKAETKLLRQVNLFDIFEGEKLGADKKSYALSFVLSDEESTLQDKQIDQVMEKLMKTFEQQLGAVIRRQ